MYRISTSFIFTHFLFRDYFFEKYDEFFKSADEEKESILNELMLKSRYKFTLKINENYILKHNWKIIHHVFNDDDGIRYFYNSEIIFIELPKPEYIGEAYYICLGICYLAGVYQTILPFYMLLEYIDDNFAIYAEYKNTDYNDDTLSHFYIDNPVEPNIKSFTKAIVHRINNYKMGLWKPAEQEINGTIISDRDQKFLDKEFKKDCIRFSDFELEYSDECRNKKWQNEWKIFPRPAEQNVNLNSLDRPKFLDKIMSKKR